MATIKKSKLPQQKSSPFKNYWKPANYILLCTALVLLMLGFYFLSFSPWQNSTALSVAPIVLLVSYLVVIPLSIFYKKTTK